MKLFEIPVYALTKDELAKRVEKRRSRLINEASLSQDDLQNEAIVRGLSVFPKNQWAFNHIVGFIEISYEKKDVFLYWYTSVDSKKYHWESNLKRFFQSTRPFGYHFYTGNIKSGDELQKRINGLLNEFIRDLKTNHSGYYVDLETFHNLDKLIDYSQLL